MVREFALVPSDRRGLDEWLGVAEWEAASAGHPGDSAARDAQIAAWAPFHAGALDALCAVVVSSERGAP